MQLFSTVLLVVALAAGLVDATPTRTTPLLARADTKSANKNCKSNEFWYEQRSCCLANGGPEKAPTPPIGVLCPLEWYFHHGQGCCVPRIKPRTPPTPTCPQSGWGWSKGLQCCSKLPPPPPPPKPSPKSKEKGKVKRNFEQWDLTFCPTGLTTCPVASYGVLTGDSECVDTNSELTSCGGCASLGEGKDCSTIPNASCMNGVCVVDA